MVTSPWDPFLSSFSFHNLELARAADPSDGKFNYLTNRNAGARTTKQMRVAELNLDNAWSMLDQYCKRRTGEAWSELFDRDIIHGRTIYRTPAWTPRPKISKQGRDLPLSQAEHDFIPLHPSAHDTNQDITGNFDKSTVAERVKTKTRAAGAPVLIDKNSDAGPDLGDGLDAPSPSKVDIDKRLRTVF